VTVQGTPDIVDLARRASAGETRAADGLLRELEPLVVRTVRLVVGSGSWAAEDAAQDALLDIDRGIHRRSTSCHHACARRRCCACTRG
jgi:DNA-directed RNA polymerase specialized sigma24 family protein